MLEGITRAFDEWRVRGTDALQRIGIGLAVLVVAFGFIPEALNAIFNEWQYAHLVHLSRIGTLIFVLIGIGVFLRRSHLGTLGSSRFRDHHRQLQTLLASCATDRLTRLSEDGWARVRAKLGDPGDEAHEWDSFFAEWDGRDRALAEQCAELLDELARFEVSQCTWSERPPRLGDLANQVERWALKALLISERPRQFWKFPLPRLTFLYRFYPMMGSELVSSSIVEPKVEVVSDADLQRTVEDRCSGHREQIGSISSWAQRQIEQSTGYRRPSARHFVEAMGEVGLKAGITHQEFRAMVARMREQLARTERPSPQADDRPTPHWAVSLTVRS